MTQLLTETPTEAAHAAALKADHLERDREAWNLPQAPDLFACSPFTTVSRPCSAASRA
jgi:hypothetical protein